MICTRFTLAGLTLLLGATGFAGQTKVVLGKLGQATSASAIHFRPSSSSGVYYRVQAYQYLIVRQGPSASWTKVLMSNGRYGYVSANAVAELPYEIVQKPGNREASRPAALMSRGGAVARGGEGAQAANYALNFIGTPYKWGGNDEYNGIDCSGFVKKVYGTIGESLPRTAAEQATVGQPIERLEDLRAGDRLYFWDSKRGKIGHTGIYLGNTYFVHASSGHGQVATDYLGSAKWLRMLVAARR